MLIIALTAMTSCSSNNDKDDEPATDPQPATQEQLDTVSDYWYAVIPISGDTDNWRTEEEGDLAPYNNIIALFYLNGAFLDDLHGYWGYLYMQDDDMVNFGGLSGIDEEAALFSFTMDDNGAIKPQSHLPNAPKISNMHYDSQKDVITADVDYMGHNLHLTFVRPTDETWDNLEEIYEMLLEAGSIGGYEDYDDEQWTDVVADDATEPQRARRRSINK